MLNLRHSRGVHCCSLVVIREERQLEIVIFSVVPAPPVRVKVSLPPWPFDNYFISRSPKDIILICRTRLGGRKVYPLSHCADGQGSVRRVFQAVLLLAGYRKDCSGKQSCCR